MELIRTLYRQRIWVAALNPFNAALVGAVLWPWARGGLIVAWVAAATLATVARALLRRRYLSAPPAAETAPRWARRFTLIAGVSGLLWGVGGAAFYDPQVYATQLILLFVIGGMAAGAAGTLAYHLPAFLAYAALAVVPTAVRIMFEGDRLHLAMGVMCLAYVLALVMVAANTNRAVTEAFRLRFDNEELLARLLAAQGSLEEANRTLEARVAERGAALERQAEALRDAQRMESLGLLAGGVAHDFNNLLTVMLGNAHLALGSKDLAVDGRAALEEIRGAAERGAALVRQLLAFSRRQTLAQRVLDLNGAVSDMQGLLARLIGEHIELGVILQEGPLPIRTDPVQLEQIIVNLATNARDAMPGGGSVIIETQAVSVPSSGPGAVPGASPGPYVVLSVRDTGTGMNAETRRLAFDPFFTTKEVGRGTGLGLATVYGIVEQSGGRVLVESEVGKGSCFRVYFPRAEGAIEADADLEARAPARPTPPATVLVAEDDGMVRAVIARALRGAGFVVIEAEDGEQALQEAERHDGSLELLVTDVVMSKLGGVELAKGVAALRPGLAVLYVSGYSWNADLPASDASAGVDFLRKPFTPDAVVERAVRLVARASGRWPGASPGRAQATRGSDRGS